MSQSLVSTFLVGKCQGLAVVFLVSENLGMRWPWYVPDLIESSNTTGSPFMHLHLPSFQYKYEFNQP